MTPVQVKRVLFRPDDAADRPQDDAEFWASFGGNAPAAGYDYKSVFLASLKGQGATDAEAQSRWDQWVKDHPDHPAVKG